MEEARRVRVIWDEPIRLDDVLSRTGEDDCGLYQIYAHHVVFGPGSLVYIGKAVEQTFGVRFRAHRDGWLHEENDVTVRLGRLDPEDYEQDEPEWEDWTQLVSDVEALLIYWHSPPYNSRHINDYDGAKLHVRNRGNRGSLLPECSSTSELPRPREE